METIKTSDLGHGWFAALKKKDGAESLAVLNTKTGERTVLGDRSVKTLREIFNNV